jgi:hypothetical protein
VPKTFFIDNVFPNPIAQEGKIRIASPKNTEISFRLYNILGQNLSGENNIPLQTGIYELTVNAQSLEQGVYFLVVFYEGRLYIKSFRKIPD